MAGRRPGVLLILGALLLGVGFALPDRKLPALPSVVPVGDSLMIAGLLLVAVLGAQDALLRRDARNLPLVAASMGIATFWSAHLLALPGVLPQPGWATSQTRSCLFLVGHLATPTLLALALVPRPGRSRHPGRQVLLALVPPVLAAALLAGLAALAAPQLPPLVLDDGSFTGLHTAAAVAAIVAAAGALLLFLAGRRGDERVAAGMAVALALLLLHALGLLLLRQRFDLFFYVSSVVRLLPVFALIAAQLGLHRHSIREEQLRVRDLRLLHEAATAVAGSLDLEETLARIAWATLDVFRRLDPGARVTIFKRDRQDLVVVVRSDASGDVHSGPERVAIEQHSLLRDMLASSRAATWQIEDLEGIGAATAEPLRRGGYVTFVNSPIPGPGGFVGVLGLAMRHRLDLGPESMKLLESMAQLAGLAMANAESFGRLAESESRFRTMFEGAGLAMLVQDPDGLLVEINPAGCALFGYSREELLGRPAGSLTHAQDRARDDERAAQVLLRARGIERWEKRVVRRDGGTVWVEVTAAPFPGLDDEPSVLTMLLDLSERRRAEAAARESREQTRFLATMSHELRTPLASVIGFAQLLDSRKFGELNQDQARHVANILESGRHLLGLVDEVLDFSRLEAGRTDVSLGEVDLGLVLQQCLAELAPIADEKHVDLSHARLGRFLVRSNRLRLRQVLFNLLANAVKFTPAGGQVCVSAELIGGLVCISVSDSGIGVALEQQDRIFEEFTQLDDWPEAGVGGGSGGGLEHGRRQAGAGLERGRRQAGAGLERGRRQAGAGLGLAVARRLAELMGGRLVVCSQPGLGSLFRLTQPAVAGAERSPRRRRPAAAATEAGLTVLRDPLGRLGGAALEEAVAQELAVAEQHGYPVVVAALAGNGSVELPAAARSGDIVACLPGGTWVLVLPNADLGMAREILARALSGSEPGPGRSGLASSEETPGARLLKVALAGVAGSAGRDVIRAVPGGVRARRRADGRVAS